MAGSKEFTRYRAKNLDKSFSGSPRAKSDKWQLIIERDIENPEFVSKADAISQYGSDMRTSRQKRRSKTEQRTKMYSGEPVTEAKAKEAARLWMKSENNSVLKPDESNMFVADYVDEFLNNHDVADSTMTGYLDAAKHIRNHFAETRMSDLTTKDVENWLSKLKKMKYSEQTRYRDYKVLHMVCRYAARRDINVIPYDPTESVRKRPEANKTRENAEANCLTFTAPDGQEPTYSKHLRILEEMEPTPMVTAAYIATYTGMRIGEICGLRWRDIDFNSMTIRVRNAIGVKGRIGNEKCGAYLKDAKTAGSKRDIPLNRVLVEELNRRKEVMMHGFEKAGIEPTQDEFGNLFVIGSIDGSFAHPTTLTKQWTAHASSFGLKSVTGSIVTFHGLRHTFASKLTVVDKIDIRTVADILGHANAAMTLNVYSSSNEQAKRDAISGLGE